MKKMKSPSHLLIQSHWAKVPLLGGLLFSALVDFGSIDLLHSVYDTNIIVVGQHFRHSAHLRGEYQIKIILGNVKIHNVASFALKNLNACNAAFVWNKY